MSLEFRVKFTEETPRALPVYRLHRPVGFPMAAAALSKVAQQMGLAGRAAELCVSEEWTTHREGLHDLSMHTRSGALVYQHRERYQRQGDKAFALSDKEADAVATRFLERTELLSREERRLAGVTHLRTAGASLNGEQRTQRVETLLDAGVFYKRVIQRIQVEGPGGLAAVYVDPEGEVAGFRIIWRPVAETVDEVKILPPDRAYAVMKEIAARLRGDVVVTKATFGYFEQGAADAQEYLQPAYGMVYVVQDGEVAFKSAEVVAAADRTFEPLRGEKRFPMPRQTPRKASR